MNTRLENVLGVRQNPTASKNSHVFPVALGGWWCEGLSGKK